MLNNLDMRSVDVRVGCDKVAADDGCELLGWVDRVLFGEDVGGLLLSVGSNDYRVVCFGVAA